MQDISFSRVQFSFFFPGEHAPEPPYIIRTFGADSTLVSPVTLVLNAVQLQKTPYLDQMNDDTEKQWSKIYIILDENRSLNTKETTKKKTKAAVKRVTRNVQLVLQHCCKPS